ncbi:MAG TPA: HNH endonuclease domain-containing protein [Polyangia bacterium]|jgi:hypothetical protein
MATATYAGDLGPIALAERVLALLAQGSFSATYKYAVFIALMDLCLEKTSRSGAPPEVLTTRQLAHKVVELYWPHAGPFEGRVLRQGGVRPDHQAEILTAIVRFRACADPSESLGRARLRGGPELERLVRLVEWKLIEMPLVRLQRIGSEEDRFLYQYNWDERIRRSTVGSYQDGRPSTFDNRILLKPRVSEHLVRLNGVVRPLVHREWAAMVSRMNDLPESQLEDFLFGVSRRSLQAVRDPLRDAQSDQCFYCGQRLGADCEVDHFVPWARYPDNGLDNLVAAHRKCNGRKSDFLAAADHVERWVERGQTGMGALTAIAADLAWERDPNRTRSVAVAIYRAVPDDARLWLTGCEFVRVDEQHRDRLKRALAS